MTDFLILVNYILACRTEWKAGNDLMLRFIFIIFIILNFNNIPAESFKNSPVGVWQTYDELGGNRFKVKIEKTTGGYQGTIIYLSSPKDSSGVSRVCNRCLGVNKDLPLLGFPLIQNIQENSGKFDSGVITDPFTGKKFDCSIEIKDYNLIVRSYAGFRLIGKNQIWKRIQ